jgi:hypothetical protein
MHEFFSRWKEYFAWSAIAYIYHRPGRTAHVPIIPPEHTGSDGGLGISRATQRQAPKVRSDSEPWAIPAKDDAILARLALNCGPNTLAR